VRRCEANIVLFLIPPAMCLPRSHHRVLVPVWLPQTLALLSLPSYCSMPADLSPGQGLRTPDSPCVIHERCPSP
jgi:hypothetical protein